MKVAVIGGGIAGMAAAHGLQDSADVTLFEAQARLGGHTDTHNVLVDGRSYAVDSGVTAFNSENYPGFSSWLTSLGVKTRPTSMSFGVSLGAKSSDTVYSTASIGALFCAKRNLVSPRFLRMLLDISRFYRESRKLNALHTAASLPNASTTLGDYLAARSYSRGFVEDHIVPLCVALWSTPTDRALDLPLSHVLAFMDKHKLLQLDGRPEWRVVEGGSNQYVSAFVKNYRGTLRLSAPVTRVERNSAFVRVVARGHDQERFDQVVFACDADQALGLMDPTQAEREILGAFRYDSLRAIVHSDLGFMPQQERAWSSWNVVGQSHDELQMTCWLNRLQSLGSAPNFFLTLNPAHRPRSVWAEREYRYPSFSTATQIAQSRRDEINGVQASYFAGAYWGLGTHEDGFASGASVAAALAATQQVAATA